MTARGAADSAAAPECPAPAAAGPASPPPPRPSPHSPRPYAADAPSRRGEATRAHAHAVEGAPERAHAPREAHGDPSDPDGAAEPVRVAPAAALLLVLHLEALPADLVAVHRLDRYVGAPPVVEGRKAEATAAPRFVLYHDPGLRG